MADMKQIHDFAVKWFDKFRNKKINYLELIDHYMADDCEALGFVMDCGHSFTEKYGDAASNCEAWERIIGQVTDIPLLGSAIYSQWRYFNYWAYSGDEILKPQNRSWFILALSRLALLTGEPPFIFQGEPQKNALCRIISAMVYRRNQRMRSNSILQSMLKDGFGFLRITSVRDSVNTKKSEVRYIRLIKL